MKGLFHTLATTLVLLGFAVTRAQAVPLGPLDPCRWSLDGSFVSTLFLRLHALPIPNSAGTYLESSRFSFRPSSPKTADLVVSDATGKHMGYLSIIEETLNDAQGIADLPGYSLDIALRPDHQRSGLGTLLLVLTAHHLDKRGLKLRVPVSHSDAVAKSFTRFEASKLIKRIQAREDSGSPVQIWEFDVSPLSDKDRLDLDAIRIEGISEWIPNVSSAR